MNGSKATWSFFKNHWGKKKKPHKKNPTQAPRGISGLQRNGWKIQYRRLQKEFLAAQNLNFAPSFLMITSIRLSPPPLHVFFYTQIYKYSYYFNCLLNTTVAY